MDERILLDLIPDKVLLEALQKRKAQQEIAESVTNIVNKFLDGRTCVEVDGDTRQDVLIAFIKKGYRVEAYDWRGFKMSTKPIWDTYYLKYVTPTVAWYVISSPVRKRRQK